MVCIFSGKQKFARILRKNNSLFVLNFNFFPYLCARKIKKYKVL
jgi:hypothetical protein